MRCDTGSTVSVILTGECFPFNAPRLATPWSHFRMTPYPEQTRPRFSHFAHVGTLRSHLTRRLLQTRQSAARVSKEAHQNVLWKLSSAIIPLDASSCLEFITVRRLTLHPRDHQTHYGSHWTEDYHTGKHRMCTSNTRLFGGTTFRQDGVRWMSIDTEKL